MANSRRSYSLKDKRDIVRAVDCRIDKSYFIQLHVGVMCGVSVMWNVVMWATRENAIAREPEGVTGSYTYGRVEDDQGYTFIVFLTL